MNYAVNNRNTDEMMNIHELIQPGPVENGFYLLSGSRKMVPMVSDRLVDFLNMESHINRPLRSKRQETGVSSEIGKLMWIDSGNSFDPYHMAQSAVRRGLNPRRIVRSIQVARPFTAFQFQQMLDKVPKPSIFKVSEESNSSEKRVCLPDRQVQRSPLVIISDLMSLFYDSEIQERDVRRAFQEFMIALSFLKKRAIVVGLQIRYPAPPDRTQFLPELLSQADRILSPKEYFPTEFPRYAGPPVAGLREQEQLIASS